MDASVVSSGIRRGQILLRERREAGTGSPGGGAAVLKQMAIASPWDMANGMPSCLWE